MEKITSIEEGVKRLYEVGEYGEVPSFEYYPAKEGEYVDTFKFNGKIYPLFWWRSEPQIASVVNSAKNRMGSACSMKISGAVSKDCSLDKFLYRQIDIAEWALNSKIKHLTSFVYENAANCILRMENETVAILELGSSLPPKAQEQTRHTVWGTQGMKSTRVVSNKIRPQAVYYYDNEGMQTFNDNMYYLYGLTEDEVPKVIALTKVLLGKFNPEEWLEKDKILKSYVKDVHNSSDKGCRIDVKEVH